MARHPPPTDEELNQARAVFERAYMDWVQSLAEELIFDAYNEDLDHEDLNQRMDERTDGGSGGLIYTADQWVCLQASRSTDEALDEMRDMGMDSFENLVALWSTLTYRIDVRKAMNDAGELMTPIHDGDDLDERVAWLIDEHGKKTVELKDDWRATIIGEVEDVPFGILLAEYNSDGDLLKHEFVGRSIDDPMGLQVLLDSILEEGEYGPESQALVRGRR